MLCPVDSFQNCLVRVTPQGHEALVTDFGLAREVVELPVKDVERKLSLVGSAFWMAPEMLRGEPYDRKVCLAPLPAERADVSSACCWHLPKAEALPSFWGETLVCYLDHCSALQCGSSFCGLVKFHF